MDAYGERQNNLTNSPADEWGLTWSPDGEQIAFNSSRDGNAEIYVMGADGDDPINLTNSPGSDEVSAWFDSRVATALEPAGKLRTTWGRIKTK